MFTAYVTVPCTSSHPWCPQELYKQKKNRTFSRKALKSKVWSPGWALVPLNAWHQISLQAMANLLPTSIGKFGLQAPSSHHFPSALLLVSEISGTEIDGSFKEDAKEMLGTMFAFVLSYQELPCFQRAEVSTPTGTSAVLLWALLGVTQPHSQWKESQLGDAYFPAALCTVLR